MSNAKETIVKIHHLELQLEEAVAELGEQPLDAEDLTALGDTLTHILQLTGVFLSRVIRRLPGMLREGGPSSTMLGM